MDTTVHVVATMISDAYIGETAMHYHMQGGDLERIRQLRCIPDEYCGEPVSLHDVIHDPAWEHVKNCRAWPMVDIWARVDQSIDYYKRIDHAKDKLRMNARQFDYDGSVGW